MTLSEQEIIDLLAEAEKELGHAKLRMVDLKNQMSEAETKLINAKIHRDRVKEQLRVHRATTPKYEASKRDEDIEQFRRDHPELVEWAKERDLNKL